MKLKLTKVNDGIVIVALRKDVKKERLANRIAYQQRIAKHPTTRANCYT